MAKKPSKALPNRSNSHSRNPIKAGSASWGTVLQEELQSALQLHQSGLFAQAEQGYLKILDQNAQHFDALQLLGTLCAQAGRFLEATTFLNLALDVQPSHPSVLNNLGYAYKELKDFERSIQAFDEALKVQPDYSEAYNNKGNAYKDSDDAELATKNYELSIIYAPQNAQAYYNLSCMQFESNQLESALKGYNQALLLNPLYFEAYTNKALILSRIGQLRESVEACDKALALQPGHPQALTNKGIALQLMGQTQAAVDCFISSHHAAPYSLDPLINLGNTLKDSKNYGDALAVFDKALIIDPASFSALLGRAIVLKELQRWDSALRDYERVLRINQFSSETFFNRGNLYKELREYQLAIKDYDRAITFSPKYAQAFNNRGNAWVNLGLRTNAQDDYVHAIELDPSFADAYNNLGVFLHEEMDLDASLLWLNRAANLDTSLIDPLWNKGLVLLLQGKLIEGFKLFEHRWANPRLGLSPDPRSLGKPLWSGKESAVGVSVLVYHEQGLGDTLQFARYVPLLCRLGAKVTFKVQPELYSLFKGVEHSQNMGTIISDLTQDEKSFESVLSNHDYICPLMSLPLALSHHQSVKDQLIPDQLIPNQLVSAQPISENLKPQRIRPELIIPEPLIFDAPLRLTQHWQELLANEELRNHKHSNGERRDKLRIGIVWSGRKEHLNDHNRSIPFEKFIKHLPVNHLYFSIQKEIRSTDVTSFQHSVSDSLISIVDLKDEIKTFEDTCAALKHLDLVISVDTSVAHLGACVGIPTLVLLPYSPDWRWLSHGSSSAWYPTMTLFRQPRIGDWDSPLELVSRHLQTFAG